MDYNITLTANHQSLTAKYLPLAAESVQYLTAKVVYETDDWTGREIKAMFEQGRTVYEVPVTGGEITAKQQLNLTAGDWRVWLVGNSARDGDVIPRITTNVTHIVVAPTGGTEGSPFPVTPPTVEEQLRADMGNLADLTTEDKSSLVAAINEAAASGGSKDAVTYTPQSLTDEQQTQARDNIGAYTKPASGIPKSDLAEDVQTSLAKADTALQSQTIPDWNQNDETAPDYVKNRPFYTGNPVETVLVEESTVSFSEGRNGKYQGELSSTFSATVGETYKVYWDGAAYECTCVDFNNMPVIGNLSIVGPGSDTGEPFVMGILNGEGIQIVTPETSASHTVSISEFAQEVVKIDPKYIRDMYYTGDPVETVLVEESTVSFSLSENEGVYMGVLKSTFSATVGETYKVYWDGAAYECTCVTIKKIPTIGNPSIVGQGPDTGEPFIIGVIPNMGIQIVTADTSASHTISISGLVTEVVKIDEKYLPELPYMDKVNPTGTGAFSLNRKADTTIGDYSFAEGNTTTASGRASHAEGFYATASGTYSHAEGNTTTASGMASHAEGNTTTASGEFSHAEGSGTIASGNYSHAEGWGTKASSNYQHVHGKYNIEDTSNTYAEIVGNGEQLANSNAHTLDWSGNAWYAGTVEGKALILPSSTTDSTKKFKITVDDSGVITATEVT